jgi:thiol-disulfide isomerase/thioredoxin
VLAVKNNLFKSLLILGLFFTITLQAKPKLMTSLTPLTVAIDAPKLHLEDDDEEMVDIKQFKGKVTIVNFWASWCPPCTREMGSLDNLYRTYKDKGLVVLAVNVGEDSDAIFDFASLMTPELSTPILYDKDSKAMETWKAIGLPSTYVINKKGKIVYKAVGGRDFNDEKITKVIEALLNE